MGRPQSYGRRDVRHASAALGIALGLPSIASAQPEPQIRKRVTLGKTGADHRRLAPW